MCLEALTRVNVAARNRVITTRAGEFRAGPVAEIAKWINPMEPLPIDAAGLIAIDIQYVRRNFRTRSTLERRGIPSTSIIRLPVNDEGVARRINGTEADFSSAEYIRARNAINHLNETQFAMLNNDLLATIGEVFDVTHIIGTDELYSQASGLILLANLRMQILAAAARGVRYMGQILKEAEAPKLTMKDFLGTLALIESAVQREAMVHKESRSWVSGDTMRRITDARATHTESIPETHPRLRARLVDASLKIDLHLATGTLVISDVRAIYAEAYRAADSTSKPVAGISAGAGNTPAVEAALAAREYPRNDRQAKPRTQPNAPHGGKKGPGKKQSAGRRYYSLESKKRDAGNDQRTDKRRNDPASPDKVLDSAKLRELTLEVEKLKSHMARLCSHEQSRREEIKRPTTAAKGANQRHHSSPLQKGQMPNADSDGWTSVKRPQQRHQTYTAPGKQQSHLCAHVVRVQGRARTGKAQRSSDQGNRRQQQPRNYWGNSKTPPRGSSGSISDSPPDSLTSSPGSESSDSLTSSPGSESTTSQSIQELRRELKQLQEQLRASNEDTSSQMETSVSTNDTLETGLQDQDLLLESRQPVSPASTVSSTEVSSPERTDTDSTISTPGDEQGAAHTEGADSGSDSEADADEPPKRVRRASARKSAPPLRYKPSTSSVTKTASQAKIPQVGARRRKASGVRGDKRHHPGDDEADIVGTTAGGTTEDN